MDDSPRTLILLRHAKSAWPEDVPDFQRPLTGRGRRDAPAVGRWLRQQAPLIDLVVCSPAVRARQTWQLAAAQLDDDPPLCHEERLYGSCAETYLTVLHQLPPDASTVLLVGHNPSLEHLLELLTGATRRVRTAAVAVLTGSLSWATARPGAWSLDAFTSPQGDDA